MLCYSILIAALTAYLLGNLNGAVCMSAIVAGDDVRSHGSGNAGLTNFIRNYGRKSALFVVLIDGGKAVAACLCAGLLLEPYGLYREGMMLGATAVILGHDFPALLGFRGGKGILCGCAIALTLDWRVGIGLIVLFSHSVCFAGLRSRRRGILRGLRPALPGQPAFDCRCYFPGRAYHFHAPGKYSAASEG